MAQQSAFATGVLPDIYAFHRYTGNSLCPYHTQALLVSTASNGVELHSLTADLQGRLRTLYAQ